MKNEGLDRFDTDWYAALYGCILKAEGYDADEVLLLVAQRYPHTAARLEGEIRARSRERVEKAQGASA